MGVCLSIGEVHLAYEKFMKWPIPPDMPITEALRSVISSVGEDKVRELQKQWKKAQEEDDNN